ncbi:diaminopimelate epimerase [Pseudomonas huanghezhanensis]|uniref:hypothetical protein n=1 Tax=Pseudomonas huanghezhanensis TaxID=3002903 RepID=UPI002E1F5BAE
MRVHHYHGDSPSPVVTHIDPAQVEGVSGFWLDIGTPGFGPETVGVVGPNVTRLNLGSAHAHRVERLSELHPDWNRSVVVRVGNPHCVTLVPSVDALPGFSQLHESPLNEALTAIAFAFGDQGRGDPCPEGINLQWAAHLSGNRIVARVFERGEGPTASSGTSASAVASAAWLSGWVKAGRVEVVMPGGTAPLELHEAEGRLVQVRLFGTARRQAAYGRTD